MCETSDGAVAARNQWVENVLLAEMVTLHPERLTADELVLRLEEEASGTTRPTIEDAIQALRRSGLVRTTGEVLEPTHAALRAAGILGI